MRQIQRQTQTRHLALTQTMRASIALLSMGPDEVREAVRREQSRNGFLRSASIAPSEGNFNKLLEKIAEFRRECGIYYSVKPAPATLSMTTSTAP
jgi:DNA-directed RNA polymerase specialized sigma54-like protein